MDAAGPGRPKAPAGPIAALARRLGRLGPSSLSHLLAVFGDADSYAEFLRIVREFLPEQAEEILGQDPRNAMGAFAYAFEARYFPLEHLEAMDVEGLEDVTRMIPVHFNGLSYDDYHALSDDGPPYLLAHLLVDFETEMGFEGEGIRITLLEEAVKHVPRELLDRIPQGGYSLEFLDERLPGTAYQGLLVHARWLCKTTECAFLDGSDEDLWNDMPNWDRRMVDVLTHAWQHFLVLSQEEQEFFAWWKDDLLGNLKEILNFLEGRSEDAKDPRQLELPLGAT